jgi:hypothetical protein
VPVANTLNFFDGYITKNAFAVVYHHEIVPSTVVLGKMELHKAIETTV